MNYNKIKELAEKTNISIIKLAELTGLSPQGIHLFVRKNNCTVIELEKISKVLGVSPAYWWQEEETTTCKEHEPAYGPKATIALLESQLNDKEKLIARLEKELAKYEDKT